MSALLLSLSLCSGAQSESEIETLKNTLGMLLQQMEALQQKIAALESKAQENNDNIHAVIEEKKEQDALLEKNKAKPVLAFWKNDFFLSTPDEEFWMKIRGNIHFDTKFYRSSSKNPSEFDIRRARLDFQGMFYKYIAFRVQPEFADSPYIRNAWVDYQFKDWLHLRGGQMKPPFSTSWWTLDNRVNFLERGAGTPVYPYFDRGWWLWGELFQKTFTWNVSAWTGAGMELDDKKGDIDDHKDFIGRFFWSRQSVPTTRFEKAGLSGAIRDDKFWTWNTGDNAEIDQRNRFGAELHYIYSPFAFSTEYLKAFYEDISVFADDGTRVIEDDGSVTSWSTWVSYFLTGEQKQVSNEGWKQPEPKTAFDPVRLQGTGAWEVLFRYTLTDTSRSLFDIYSYGGDAFTILSGAPYVNEFTVGLSWTWNSMVRWQFNYVYLDGHGLGVQSGDKGNPAGTQRSKVDSMFGTRMIFKF